MYSVYVSRSCLCVRTATRASCARPPLLRLWAKHRIESNQATTENSGPRSVEVEVELGGRGGSFLVVRDNGKGMNASDLKDFATYFLTQVR